MKDGLCKATRLTTAIARASQIVNHVRRSHTSSQLLKEYNKLKANIPTRWNSQIKMVRSVLEIPADIIDTVPSTVKLGAADRQILDEFIYIMRPFEMATDINQGDNYITASTVVPTILGLRYHLDNLSLKCNVSLVKELHLSVTKRLQKYVDSETYRCASALDPRFKAAWCSLGEREALIQLVTSLCRADVHEEPQRKCSCPEIFAYMQTEQDHDRNEVFTYFNEPAVDYSCDPLLYWKNNTGRFPSLSTTSCKYLCVPATSAPVERIFSRAGKITRADRSRLRPSMVENLVFISCNLDN